MDEERLLILKMLEQGKISADEAASLLEALEERDVADMSRTEGESVDQGDADDKIAGNTGDGGKKEEGISTSRKLLGDETNDDWAARVEQLGRRAEEWGREVEESVAGFAGRLQETIEQKLVPGLENLGDWVSTSRFRLLGQRPPGVHIDRQYRGRFTPQPLASADVPEKATVSIRLATRNGHIKVTATEGQEYVLRIHGRVRAETQVEAEAWISSLVERALSDTGIQMDLTHPEVVVLHIELAIPKEQRYQIVLNSVNGSVSVQGHGLKSSTAAVETVNGGVSVDGLTSEYLRVATKNGGISLADLQTERGEASTTNGGLAASLSSLSGDWQLNTRNGGIAVNLVSAKPSPRSGKWRIQTTNGGISVALPAATLPPISFRAQTRLGKVQVEAAPLVFRRVVREHGRHYVEGILGNATDSTGTPEGTATAGQGGSASAPEFQLELETTLGSIAVRQG